MAYRVITIGRNGEPLSHATFERTMPTDYCTVLAKGDYIGVIITYEDLLFWFTGGVIQGLEHTLDVFMRANAEAHNFLTEHGISDPANSLIDRLKAYQTMMVFEAAKAPEPVTVEWPEVPHPEPEVLIPNVAPEVSAEATVISDDDIPF